MAGRVRADLVGRDDEGLVLDRPRPDQRLPVVARRRQRERGGNRDDPRAPDGEDPVELGEAQVVADGQAQGRAAGGFRQDDLGARILGGRLAVDGARDLDVEHVDLAVDGLDLAVGADVDARVGGLLLALDALDDRAGEQVDGELAGDLARPRDGGSVERLGGRRDILGRADEAPLLRQGDELGAVGRRCAHEALGGGEVGLLVVGRVELDGCGSHGCYSLSIRGLTGQSIPLRKGTGRLGRIACRAMALPYRSPGPGRPTDLPLPPGRMPMLRGGRPLKRWRYVGVFGPEVMLCAGRRASGRAARRGGRSGTAAWRAARAHAARALRRCRSLAGRVRVRDRDATIDLCSRRARGSRRSRLTARSTSGRASRAVRARGRVMVGRREWQLDSARDRRRVGGLPRAPHGVVVVGGRRRSS